MIKKHKWKIIAAVVILCALGFTFWYGGNAPGLHGWDVSVSDTPSGGSTAGTDSAPTTAGTDNAPTTSETAVFGVSPDSGAALPEETSGDPSASASEGTSASISETTIPAAPEGTVKKSPEKPPKKSTDKSPGQSPGAGAPSTASPGSDSDRPLTASEKLALAKSIAGGQSSQGVEKGDADYSRARGMDISRDTGKDRYLTDPVPEGKPVPVEPQNAVITDKELTCTLSVRCDTIRDNMSWLDKEKWELVPEDGVIFPATKVTFYEGESVFNVLRREMKKAGIHMEFTNTPIYNSVYIEGINNLYEFDVGELSGWMYKVNGWFPNYGCSRYQLHDGDIVEWVYTCNLGIDVGGYYAAGGS